MADGIPPPEADRTQLQQIIAELPEGIIIINPDQSIAWSNAAGLTMHGVKSLKELGETVSEYRKRFELRYRNQHRLPAGSYPMDRVVAGETFSEVIVEVGRPGEEKRRVHQIRSLVITDPEGQPDCLVLIIEDETARFDAEERFERTFGANPAPAIIARLSDMRYVKVNHGFIEMTGYVQEALIGKSIHEIDVLERADKRELAVERLHAGRTIPQMDACLTLPDRAEKAVIVAGHPIEVGDEDCMLFTFADLHRHKQSEHALRLSEERFSAAFHLAPGPMAILALKGMRLLSVNDAFTAVTGWRREEVIGRTDDEVAMWGDGAARSELARLLKETGHLQSVDVCLTTKSGGSGNFLLSAETVTINGELCVLVVMQDITDRKQTEVELLTAIEAVMRDSSWFGEKIVEKLAGIIRQAPQDKPGSQLQDLTPRGRELLGLIAQGFSDVEVAGRLGISTNTIRNHVSAIYKIVGVRRRSALIVWARERGLGIALKAKSNKDAKSTNNPK